MAPGIRSFAAAASLTGALLLTPLPDTLAATPSPGLPPTTVASGTTRASPRTEPSPASPRATPSPTLSEERRLAGSRAGEGRIRPGRVEPPHDLLPDTLDAADPDEVAPAQVGAAPQTPPQVPPPESPQATPRPTLTVGGVLPPARRHQAPQAVSTGSDLRVHVLSLGAGLALTGLGIGFLALRLRRP
ncbi:hypothetical protein [Streptomyces sp. WM6378]|uniref:hypothetical protein n=1 Tax=Streptomyces sp. WM6378 TaxID=1415557 RepID=UPI0006AE6A19|nr:hypothetical protein [Streptomyces sp. WM6378]